MRKLFLSAILSILASGAALAADIPAEPMAEPVAPVAAPVADWTGPYVGVIGGWGWADFDVRSSGVVDPGDPVEIDYPDFSIEDDGGFIGGQIGYDHQIGSFVVGVVGDASWTDLSGSDGVPVDTVLLPCVPFPQCQTTVLAAADSVDPEDDFAVAAGIDWFATLRAKAGFAFGNFMVYGTGGLAFGGTETEVGYRELEVPSVVALDVSLPDDFESTHHDDTRVGFAVGGGVAARLGQHIVAELGYLFVDLGEETFDVEDEEEPTRGHADVDYQLNLVRAGLSYKF